MNAERLREVADELLAAEGQHNIQNHLAQVRDQLQQLVQNPQNPGFQTQLAATLDTLREATRSFLASFTPVQIKSFEEIRATEVFVSDVASEVDRLIQENPMTPQVALEKISQMVGKREAYLSLMRELQNKLQAIGIEPSRVQPGQAEIGILIPRALFQNHLAELINELRALNMIVRAFSEVATGAPEPAEIHQISTSDPVFILGLSVSTIALFGKVVKWALETWKQVEEIKKVRAEAQRIKVFTEKEIKDTFDGKIDESIKLAIDKEVLGLLPPSDKDTGREHELRTNLAWALDSVLTRVERGMTVEIRFLPPPAPAAGTPADEEAAKNFDALREIAPQLTFPPPEPTPVRPLPPPEPPAR